jgi:hypothetical protein
MKTTPVLLGAALAAAAVSCSSTGGRLHARNSTVPKPEPTALTGSYIERPVQRHGLITDGPNPTYVVDQQAIENTGAADLSQVLIRSGFRR